MIFFIDFDRTVFNAHHFLNDLVRESLNKNVFDVTKLYEYVYPDALTFLEKRKEDNDTTVLVTRGDPEVQKTKAEYARVLDFFSAAQFVSEGAKSRAIGEYLETNPLKEGEQAFFIDDTVFELQDVKNTHPFITPIRMRRADAKNLHIESPELTEAADFNDIESML